MIGIVIVIEIGIVSGLVIVHELGIEHAQHEPELGHEHEHTEPGQAHEHGVQTSENGRESERHLVFALVSEIANGIDYSWPYFVNLSASLCSS